MAFFEWKEEYSVEVPSIDIQHKRLVGMLNDLYDAMSNRAAAGPVLKKIIGDLLIYTKTHFTYEEQLLQKHGYPEFEEHKKKHVSMTKRVQDFADEINQGKAQPTIEFATFLKNWLQQHIQGTDKRYSSFLKDKGAV